jgi:L-ascorbate metabolism protein UlaG (beta-lactamase superfamily)
MTIKFTWLGHSAFLFDVDGHSVLADPFLTGNPLAPLNADDLTPEVILLSHAHSDHLGDTVPIAGRTGAGVVTNVEIGDWLGMQDIAPVYGMNLGGTVDLDYMTVKLTLALHSSSFADGRCGGVPVGFIVSAASSGQRAYFAGDTALFSDMALIGDERIDVAFLPIGDYFTMGIADSIRAVQLIRPRFVVPMHYNTFPLLVQDVSHWAARISNETDAVPIVLDPGGAFTLPE